MHLVICTPLPCYTKGGVDGSLLCAFSLFHLMMCWRFFRNSTFITSAFFLRVHGNNPLYGCLLPLGIQFAFSFWPHIVTVTLNMDRFACG